MKQFLEKLYKVKFSRKDNKITISGNYFSDDIFFIPLLLSLLFLFIVKINISLPLFIFSIIYIPLSMLFSVFKIEISKDNISFNKYLFGVPIKKITTPTSSVIIDHMAFKEIKIISLRKDYYSEDIKDNLRFEYIEPMDARQEHVFVFWKGKEIIEFWSKSEAELWHSITKAFILVDN